MLFLKPAHYLTGISAVFINSLEKRNTEMTIIQELSSYHSTEKNYSMLQKHLIILRYYIIKQRMNCGIKKYKVTHILKPPVLTLPPRCQEFLFLSEIRLRHRLLWKYQLRSSQKTQKKCWTLLVKRTEKQKEKKLYPNINPRYACILNIALNSGPFAHLKAYTEEQWKALKEAVQLIKGTKQLLCMGCSNRQACATWQRYRERDRGLESIVWSSESEQETTVHCFSSFNN